MNIAFIGQKGIGMMERGGGIEKHVTEIATRLVKKGHQVTVYARRRYCPTHPLYQGVRLVCLPTIYRKNLEAILHTLFSTLHALTPAVRRHSFPRSWTGHSGLDSSPLQTAR